MTTTAPPPVPEPQGNAIAPRNVAIALPSLGDAEWEATKGCFDSGWLTQGPKVAEFEKAFAQMHGVSHALAVTSCTTGLHLMLAALDIGPGDEVIVPAFTWVATANVVRALGATVVFCDVDPVTYNLDAKQLKTKVTDNTKAVIAVHLFGLCADMDVIRAELPAHVHLLEDAACAAGAQYKGQMAGSLGLAGAFSFHPRKSITTGEGGMVTTNNPELAEKMTQMRNHGASISEEQRHHGPRPYLLPEFNLLGFNYRMTDLQGAVGLAQLPKLQGFIAERHQWTQFYQRELANIPWLRCPQTPAGYAHGWQSFVCWVDPELAPRPRNTLMDELQQLGISTRPGTHAVHMLGYYQELMGVQPEDFPHARDCDQNTLAIPLHNRMSAEDYHYVVQCLQGLS